jgi:hypothetical protein
MDSQQPVRDRLNGLFRPNPNPHNEPPQIKGGFFRTIMTNYTIPQKAFVLQTEEGSKIFGPFETQEQMRSAMADVIKQIEDADSVGQICVLEQRTRFSVRKPQAEESKIEQESVIQTDERDKAPAKEPALPQEVLDYMTSLSQNTDADLRELGNIKGVDGRITNREKLIEALTAIFIQGN